MPGSGVKHTVLDTTVACPLCLHVNIYVVFESNLDWSVTDTVNGNFRAGMTYKASLGSQMVRYDEGKGWSMETFHSPNVTRTPILEATGKAESSLKASPTCGWGCPALAGCRQAQRQTFRAPFPWRPVRRTLAFASRRRRASMSQQRRPSTCT